MRRFDPPVRSMVAARENANAIFVALELSRSNWLIAISLPHSEKVRNYGATGEEKAFSPE